MSKVLIVTALTEELASTPLPVNASIVFTGVGKLNAALMLTERLSYFQPDLVVNFGTAGRIQSTVSGLVEVAEVIQADMKAEPLAPRGQTPFDDTPHILSSGQKGVRCGTGDSFVTYTDPWLLEQGVSIVDMELFAIALVCHRRKIPWRSYKFITDDADENAGSSWKKQIHRGRDLFVQRLLGVIS